MTVSSIIHKITYYLYLFNPFAIHQGTDRPLVFPKIASISSILHHSNPKTLPLAPYLHVELEGLDRLRHQSLLYVHVQFQLIHPTTVQLLECFGIIDAIKLVEFKALPCGRQLHGSLCHLLQHLSPRQVPHVAGVGMGHQQNWVLLAYLMNTVHIALGGLGAADLALPVRAIKVLKVTGQGLVAVQLCGKIKRGKVGVLFVPFNLLLHGCIRVVECHGATLGMQERKVTT